jgi:DNA-binding NtrC family response regulator
MTAAAVALPGPGGVLVASASSEVRDQVQRKLRLHGPVHTAQGGAEALAKLESGDWQVLFLDRRLPDLNAEELSGIIERRYPGVELVLIDSTPEGLQTNMAGWMRDGRTASGSSRGPVQVQKGEMPLPGMIGDTSPMREVYRKVRLVAGRETTVLVTGPTGSGKDLVARALHQLSARSGNGFFVLNCAAIPDTLVESELFGYARGAFTGASQTYAGRILAAQGGTLFLDEIGDLPLAAQSKLLRFLEQKEIQKLGSTETARADVRVVAATHQDLPEAVECGKFREDLFFRLSAFPIQLAPLAERRGDLLQLANHFLSRLPERGTLLRLDLIAGQKLEAHSWPGNVRELQQVLERAAILADGSSTLLPEHIVFSPLRKSVISQGEACSQH